MNTGYLDHTYHLLQFVTDELHLITANIEIYLHSYEVLYDCSNVILEHKFINSELAAGNTSGRISVEDNYIELLLVFGFVVIKVIHVP